MRQPPEQWRATALKVPRVMAGRIWIPTEAGMTFPDRGRYGSQQWRWTRTLIPMAMGAGSGLPGDMLGHRDTTGAGRRFVAAIGRSGTASAGVGLQVSTVVLADGVFRVACS
jgi:hypothetical protein